LAIVCAGCGGDEKNSSSSSSSSSSSTGQESGEGKSEKPSESTPPGDEPAEPETLPELTGEEVQVNKIYQNGEALKMSIYGVSFKLPEKTACAIGEDATAMQLAATDKQC